MSGSMPSFVSSRRCFFCGILRRWDGVWRSRSGGRPHPRCPGTAFGRARLIKAADGLRMRIHGRDDMLTLIPQHRMVPGNRIEQTLQRPGHFLLVKCHDLDILSLHARHQSANIHQKETSPGPPPSETTGNDAEVFGEVTSSRRQAKMRIW